MSVEFNVKQGFEQTSKEIQQINSHLKTISKQESLKQKEVELLYGRLQYSVQKLQNDFIYNSKQLSQTIEVNSNQNKIQQLPSLQKTRPKSQASLKKPSLLQYKPKKGFYKNSFLERNHTQKQMLRESQQFIEKPKYNFATEQNMSPIKTNSIYGTMKSIQLESYKKGRLSEKPNILPKNIRKNPWAELPQLDNKIIQEKGIFYLQNAGYAYKEIDTEPVFNQGDPVLNVQPKQVILLDPDANEPLHKQMQKMSKYMRGENLQKYKLDKNYIEYKGDDEQTINSGNDYNQNEENNIFLTAQQDDQYQLAPIQIQDNSQNQSQVQKKSNQKNYDKDMEFDVPLEQMDLALCIELQIVNYMINEKCENFMHMQNRYSHIWGSIKGIFQKLENLCRKYHIQLASIDGKKVAQITDDLYRVKESDLIQCFLNQKLMQEFFDKKNSQQGQKKLWACQKIQRFLRMREDMRKLKILKTEKRAEQLKKHKATFWLSFLISNLTIRRNISKKLLQYKEVQEEFKKNWGYIKNQKRVEIHMNSLGLDSYKRMTMDNFSIRENLQLSRLFRLKDPNLEIILISPFPLPKEIISYYYKICELGELENFKDRIHFKHPENYAKFPSYFPTSKLLYYSPFALNEIKELIQDKKAYIVPGYPNREDVLLGIYLEVPIFQGDQQAHIKYNKKKYAKQIFNECGFPVPPGVEGITDKNQLYDQLTKLIYTTPGVKTWILKIDDEFNGRGIAYFQIDSIRALNEIFKEQSNELSDQKKQQHLQKIKEIVINLLAPKIVLAQSSLYQNFEQFLAQFLKSGGIIEAMPNAKDDVINSPSIILRIDPDGSHTVLGTYDRIQGNKFVNFGCIYPQTSLPHLNFKKISQILAENLVSKDIFGYISLDMISFVTQDQKGSHPLFQVVDMDCHLNNYISSYFLFDFLSGGKLDKVFGKYYLKKSDSQVFSQQQDQEENDESNLDDIDENEERCFMYAPLIYHEGLKKMNFRDFFQACRKNQISYDLEKKQGSVFMLSNSLQAGILSLLTIHDSARKAVKATTDALNFLLATAGHTSRLDAYEQQNVDNYYLMDYVYKVRSLNKQYDKQQQMIISKLSVLKISIVFIRIF